MTPQEHLIRVCKDYPQAWKIAEDMRKDHGVGLPRWPNWCFLPIAGWYAIVCDKYQVYSLGFNTALSAEISRVAAIGTWRYSQGIYKFDQDVYKSITETDLTGKLPSDLFLKLPEWCIYVETSPDSKWAGLSLLGFWCHLEKDMNTGEQELRLVLNTTSDQADKLFSYPLHIGPWTLVESIEKMLAESAKYGFNYNPLSDKPAVEFLAEELKGIISLILYLCSDEPEISDDAHHQVMPKKAQPVKTKKGLKFFPPDKPKIWTVGKKIGDELRKAEKENAEVTKEGKRTVKPHLRRAHWHGYWHGARDSAERKYNLKWIAPTFIASKF